MNDKIKFYLDRSDVYGTVTVKTNNLRLGTKNRSQITVSHRDLVLLSADLDRDIIKITCNFRDDAEIEILNECFTQLETFRGLLLIKEMGDVFLIVDGERVPFSGEVHLANYGGTIYSAYPHIPRGA